MRSVGVKGDRQPDPGGAASRRQNGRRPRLADRHRSAGRRRRGRARGRPAATPRRRGARSARPSPSGPRGSGRGASMKVAAPVGSRFAVGSSRTSRPGSAARTPASARRCCWPPDRRRDRRRSWSPSPTASSAAGTRRCIAATRPGSVLQAERHVILDPLHHELRATGPGTRHRPGPRRRAGPRPRMSSPSRSSRPLTVPGTSLGIRPARASASVLLPRTRRSQHEEHGARIQVEGRYRPGPVGRCLDRRPEVVDADGGRGQSGNPSSTPACFSARCRRTEPPATRTTAEMAMNRPRTSWMTGSTSA